MPEENDEAASDCKQFFFGIFCRHAFLAFSNNKNAFILFQASTRPLIIDQSDCSISTLVPELLLPHSPQLPHLPQLPQSVVMMSLVF